MTLKRTPSHHNLHAPLKKPKHIKPLAEMQSNGTTTTTNEYTVDKKLTQHQSIVHSSARFPEVNSFTQVYDITKLPLPVDDPLTGGISRRTQCFAHVNIPNDGDVNLERLQPNTLVLRAITNPLEFQHVLEYFMHYSFHVESLANPVFDKVFHAIVSYLLEWDYESLERLLTRVMKKYRPELERLQWISILNKFHEFRILDDNTHLFWVAEPGSTFKFIVAKCSLKLLRPLLELIHSDEMPVASNLVAIVRSEHRFNIADVCYETFWDEMEKIEYDFIVRRQPIFGYERERLVAPFPQTAPIGIIQLPEVTDNVGKLLGNSSLKFVTGMACCGKTTLLAELEKKGWRIYNRGSLGDYRAKTTCGAAVGTLHASMEFVLTQPKVIGDRGPIDNIVWKFLMECCDVRNRKTMVTKFRRFMSAYFNEPSLAYFMQQRGIIFLDSNFRENAKRMRRRNQNGDAHRSALEEYASSQFIVYYIVARLFGWPILWVPYDKAEKYQPANYKRYSDQLIQYLENAENSGKPKEVFPPKVSLFQAQAVDVYQPDMTYAIDVGIYK